MFVTYLGWVSKNLNHPRSYYIGSSRTKIEEFRIQAWYFKFWNKEKIKICLFDAPFDFDSMIIRHDICIYLLKIALLPFKIAHSFDPAGVNSRSTFFSAS